MIILHVRNSDRKLSFFFFFFFVLHHLRKCTQTGNVCIIDKLMWDMSSVIDSEAKNRIGEQSSNSELACSIHFCINILGKDTLLSAMVQIAG